MKKIIRLISLLLTLALLCSTISSCDYGTNGSGATNNSGTSGNTNDGTNGSGSTNNSGTSGNTNDGTNPSLPSYGWEVGKRCIPTDLELVLGGGTVNIEDYEGKIVVINFWGTWCGPCRSELPHFDVVAEYAEDVVIITVHSYSGLVNAPEYINQNFHNSKMIFANDNETDKYYRVLNPGLSSWPVTIVLDADGVITNKIVGAIHADILIAEIHKAKKEKVKP